MKDHLKNTTKTLSCGYFGFATNILSIIYAIHISDTEYLEVCEGVEEEMANDEIGYTSHTEKTEWPSPLSMEFNGPTIDMIIIILFLYSSVYVASDFNYVNERHVLVTTPVPIRCLVHSFRLYFTLTPIRFLCLFFSNTFRSDVSI